MSIAITLLMIFSLIFAVCGVIGMLRMPDTFCRMQTSTIISTLVVVLALAGAIVYAAGVLKNTDMVIKLAVLLVFYIVTAPISGHALAKGAYRHGTKMTEKHTCDKYGEDMEK